ncbi:DEAD/DEAH box helicase [Oceanobacillus polygoni]|uniref:SNF2 family DNA or RNA helicase n=1 Tax=Oceanobacillus polygoni TaxID=1235259 RepID=A0A9X0YNZ9_9BACI|nr:DEAD/DEAH box helicase [Oceanobacillus polygoni]MBP2076320.1 SNF2 family DNA or RNA helicase [Oceanobacillus polygoni]
MKKISDINIQKLFPPTTYKRGKDYYKQNKVSDLLYDINYQVWTATVHGSEDYFVEINMKDYTNGSIDTYCDCPAFETFGTCKHIAATLMQIANKEQAVPNAPSKPNYQLTNKFIQALRTLPQQNVQPEILPNKHPMHVEYYCNWGFDHQLQIEIRTGEKHCYVVKDAYQFLGNILQGNEYYFTKKFIFHPDTHYFLQKDLELFEMLFAIKRNEEMYQGYSRFHYEGNSGDKRYITIPPLAAKELLEKLAERDFTVESQQKSFQHIGVERDVLPFRFSLTKNDQNDLLMKMADAEEATYFPYYDMLFHEGMFYYPTKEQVQVLEEVTKFGMHDLQLPIPKAQADVFLSEVLPSLKKIGGVEVSETITAEIIQVPLRAKLYLEVKADWIIGRLEYHYGEQLIDPFNGRKDNELIIIRDVEKEQQIMQLIEQANFHYNGKELYIEADEEELYDFLYYILPLLDKEVELFLTSEIRGMIIENEAQPSTSVRLEGTSNLLEIGFDINGVDDSEINQILNAVIEKKRYYRLGSGELLSLEGEEFTSIKRFFDEMQIHKEDLLNGNVHMPVYRGTQLDELIDTKKNYDPSFRQLLHQLKSPEEQVYELPEQLQASLRNYQMTGFQWFKSLSNYHLGGILADDMGLGKTLQSIAYIASEKQEGAGTHLIVAPSSVVYNWKNEFEKFTPHMSVVVLTGTPEERHQLIEASADTDVWITSYATLRQDIEIYREFSFQSMFLDEAQYIKNYATKTSRAIREIKAARRFALSGTPIENSIDELWAIFQVVLPGLMPNQRSFKQLSNEKIAMLTRPFILRRLKKDVLKELPDKIESVHVSELTKEQKDLYVGYLRQVQQEAAQSMKESGFQQNRMKILAGLTRLRQLCCHPSLFIENYEGYSGKLEQLMDTVKTAIESGKRMLIFSQFTSMHDIIKGRLEQEGFGYFYLHGQTPAKERVEMSDRFNNGENSIFLISLKAGGTGLNLTGADTVILYDLWWNPAVEDQATGRAHRFGQKNVVQVIRLVTEGTIEEKIYALQQKKRELIDQVIQPGETMLSSLSEDDIRELLSL